VVQNHKGLMFLWIQGRFVSIPALNLSKSTLYGSFFLHPHAVKSDESTEIRPAGALGCFTRDSPEKIG
jgi:hypothetical protein